MDRLLSEPIWQDIEYRATYDIVQNYIEKAEETSRLPVSYTHLTLPTKLEV